MDKLIKFYSKNDLGIGYYIPLILDFYKSFDPAKENYSIDEIAQFFNILLYIDNNLCSAEISKEDIEQFKASLHRQINAFWETVNDDNFKEKIFPIWYEYYDDLITMLMKYEVYKRISDSTIKQLLVEDDKFMYAALQNKKFAKEYGDMIKEVLLWEREKYAEYVVCGLFEEKSDLFLPVMTTAERDLILQKYLELPQANPNYLDLVAEDNRNLVSPEVRLACRKCYKQKMQELMNNATNTLPGIDICVRIIPSQKETVKFQYDNNTVTYSFSQDYLESTLDDFGIMKNCASLFGFASEQGILTFPARISEMGLTERISVKGKHTYYTGVAFELKEGENLMMLTAYDQFLAKHNKKIEDGIKWFFEEYLPDTFGAKGFHFGASTSQTYQEKARNIFTEMESVAKQFGLYVEKGEIDPELLALKSDQVQYRDLPSLVRESSLLSKCETDYYNYCLNNKDFTNNRGYRNKYLHGSIVRASEEEHRQAYYMGLLLMIGLVIKIQDEFATSEQIS